MFFQGPGSQPQGFIAHDAGMQVAQDSPWPTAITLTPTAGTKQVSLAFTAISDTPSTMNPDGYYVEYWVTAVPTTRFSVTGTGTPIVVTGLTTGTGYSFRAQPYAAETRPERDWTRGPWSATVTATAA